MSQRLAERLKSETRALHTAAERSRFMGDLLRGRMAVPPYVAMLRNLQAIYAALEPALARHATHPAIAPIFLPGLWRSASIAHDIGVLEGAGGADARLQPSTIAYVARLRELDLSAPELLLAHAYVRYLGDLSGGQLLRGIVSRLPWAQGLQATAFYEFGDPAQARDLTQRFREGVGAVQADAETEQALVDEACRSFEAHGVLFDELELAAGSVGAGRSG